MLSSFSWGDGRITFLVWLGLAGAGLGTFVAPNNAALMRQIPRHQSGMASGALNMTRGLGTALGLAVAGLAYTVGAGTPVAESSAAASHGYQIAARVLAVVAGCAAVIAGGRGAGRGPARSTESPGVFTFE